jgi:hypothetical protein
MIDKAKQFGVSAAVLQVSAWWARVCGSSKCAWLGAAKKLDSSAPGAALCEVERDLHEACKRPLNELSNPSGSLRFCSPERKAQVCEDFKAHKSDAKKAFGKYRRQDRGRAEVAGLGDLPKSCDRAGVVAVKKLVEKGGTFG